MADNIPDFMREFDMNQDYGFTPVSSKPTETKPSVDKQVIDSKFEGTNIELSKIKSDVKDVKALMHEASQLGINFTILKATDSKNNYVRKNRNWEKMEGRAIINTNKK